MKAFYIAISALSLTLAAHAQLPLGSVSNVQNSTQCGAGFEAGAVCYSAQVSCPNLPDIGVTFGVTAGPAGTIVSINGMGGTKPGGGPFTGYTKAGYAIAQFAFSFAWEDGGNVLSSACRPATMLNYFYTPGSGKPFCAQGASAGAAVLGYALAWYGLGAELDNVEMVVGPVLSRIDFGCEMPEVAPVTINPTDGLPFEDAPQYFEVTKAMTLWTGQPCLPPNGSTATEDASWAAQSIVQIGAPGFVVNYPATSMAGYGCDNGENPSSAQSFLFFHEVTSPWTWTRLSGCTGAEGISTAMTPEGEKATLAITGHMLSQCVLRHSIKEVRP